MSLKFASLTAMLSVSTIMLSGCFAGGYTAAEQEMAETMTADKYQPAIREVRDNIETQDLFAQAAFWSREYNLNPGDLEAAIKLSASVRKMGNAAKAVEISQTSRALYPKDPYLAAEYAAALIADDRAHEAVQPLDTALRTSPGYARLWSLKGAALDQAENYDLARKHYAKALQITPNDPNIMANVGLSFALQGNAKTAEGWLRKAAAVPGASDSVRQNLALVLQLQGKTEEAEKYAPRLPDLKSAGGPSGYSGPMEKNQNVTNSSSQSQTYGSVASAPPMRGFSNNQQVAGGPKTASEAARAAAQNQTRRRQTVPVENAAEQQAVLNQIARNVGPKASGAPAPKRMTPQSRNPYQQPQAYSGQAPNPYAMPQSQPQQAYPQTYPQVNPQGYSAYPQAQQPVQRRPALRRRG